MSHRILARLFNWIGPLVASYALISLLVVQGDAGIATGFLFLDKRAPINTAYWAIGVVGIGLLVVCIIGAAHARLPRGPTDTGLPIPFVDTESLTDPAAPSIKVFTVLVFCACVMLPAYTLIRLNEVVADRGWIWNEALPAAYLVRPTCILGPWPFGTCDDAQQKAADDVLHARKLGRMSSTPNDPQVGRAWLVNEKCDVAHERHITGPQLAKPGNDEYLADEIKSRAALNELSEDRRNRLAKLGDLLSLAEAKSASCAGDRQLSDLCKEAPRHCRGVEWKPNLSPILVVGGSLSGWFGVAILIIALWRGPPRSNQTINPIK